MSASFHRTILHSCELAPKIWSGITGHYLPKTEPLIRRRHRSRIKVLTPPHHLNSVVANNPHSSDAFDLTANVAAGDSRGGLDLQGKKEVLKIMKQESCSFDEARRILMEQRLAMNGIAPDGRPLDPRAVFFS